MILDNLPLVGIDDLVLTAVLLEYIATDEVLLRLACACPE